MATIRNPHSVSTTFDISPAQLQALGVLDSTLSADTLLFVDPLLFGSSAHREFRDQAVAQYRAYFENIAKILGLAPKGDETHAACKAVRKLLHFKELPTCLGYGAASDDGSAWGPKLIAQVMKAGKEIVDLGVVDPDLFVSMALFEERIGPDRISDMATNVSIEAIAEFNARVLFTLRLKGRHFDVTVAGKTITAELLPNRYLKKTPVILLPRDILRKLPVASDWDDVSRAAAENDQLRDRVNKHVSHIWAAKTKRDKAALRAQALADGTSFRALMDAIHAVQKIPYNSDDDPDALTAWATIGLNATRVAPLDLTAFTKFTGVNDVHQLVRTITNQFKILIEQRALWRDLYKECGNPRHESTAQRIFFAVAYAYCQANNVDISPEVDTGSGKIDFKFSKGFDARVVVEIKLSTNSKVVSGFTNQLEIYKAAEQTTRGLYIVVDIGGMGQKDKILTQLRNDALAERKPVSDLFFVDGTPKKSASKQ